VIRSTNNSVTIRLNNKVLSEIRLPIVKNQNSIIVKRIGYPSVLIDAADKI
jgi:hypothetical protein